MAPKQQVNNKEIKSRLGISLNRADRMAVIISNIFGSVAFLIACCLFFLIWIVWNMGVVAYLKPIDKFPFPALEMGVSIFAIVLSVSVLISQNRQGKLEKLRQQVEFEVNVRAETEITKILHMLHEMQKKMGIDGDDRELEEMKEKLDLQQLHKQMDDNVEPSNEL